LVCLAFFEAIWNILASDLDFSSKGDHGNPAFQRGNLMIGFYELALNKFNSQCALL